MPAFTSLHRRKLMVLGGVACALPVVSIAKQSTSPALIIGLVTGQTLYAMAAQRTTKGIDWAHALSNDKLAEGKQVKTIFGSKPPRQLFAYNLLGEPLHQAVETNWTRDVELDEAGDHGFNVIGSQGLPKTYLVASEQFTETNSAVKQDLTWSEILELRARFKREVISQYSRDTFEGVNGGDSARALLAQADIVYTGSRVVLTDSTWGITTIHARRKKKDTYPGYVTLTWLETPGLKPVCYFSFGHEETFSVEFMGVWHVPGEQNPVVIVRDINKGGTDYQIRTDFAKPSHTVSMGGSGC
jgi:hypothetical protein